MASVQDEEHLGKESFSEVIKRLARERGELKDSFGAWRMSQEEEERISSSLKKHWKKATVKAHSRRHADSTKKGRG